MDHVADGADAADLAMMEPYCLVILDLMLPTVPGLEIVRQIRQRGCSVPILILTVKQSVSDRVRGLDLGADDYVSKPFDLAELEARVRALIRRSEGLPNPHLTCGPVEWEPPASFRLHGRPLLLRRRESSVLAALMTRVGKVVIKDRMVAEVFGFDDPVAPNTLELYISRLRKKLEPAGLTIRTVRGVGYLLEST